MSLSNQDKWEKMSLEEQRVKIAELAGWRNIHYVTIQTSTEDEYSDWLGQSPDGTMATSSYGDIAGKDDDSAEYIYRLPNYLNDLNAMSDIEMSIPRGSLLETTYIGILESIVLGVICPESHEIVDLRKLIMATAAQRAEAFYLVMEKKS